MFQLQLKSRFSFITAAAKKQNMQKHESATYKAGRITAIAKQLDRKQQKKEDQSKLHERKAGEETGSCRSIPGALCRAAKQATRNGWKASGLLGMFQWSYTAECRRRRDVQAGFTHGLPAWVLESTNVAATLLLEPNSRDSVNTFS